MLSTILYVFLMKIWDFGKSYIQILVFTFWGSKKPCFGKFDKLFEWTLYFATFGAFYLYDALKPYFWWLFSHIYQFSTKNCMILGPLNRYISFFSSKFSKILSEDVKVMHGKVCKVSRRYLQRYGSYSRKTEWGSAPRRSWFNTFEN